MTFYMTHMCDFNVGRGGWVPLCRQKKFAVAADILPPKFCLQNVAADILSPKTLLPPACGRPSLPLTSLPPIELIAMSLNECLYSVDANKSTSI